MIILSGIQIKKYYKIFGYVNLIFSILLVIFLKDMSLMERIMGIIGINLLYHMPYLFFSSNSINSFQMDNNINKIVGTGILKLFSVFGMIISFTFMYTIISKAILQQEYFMIFGIFIPFGILLGATNLWNDLNNK